MGVRRFDVAHHNPHPPGYPLFIGLAKIVHVLQPSEAKALALPGVVAGTLGMFALMALFRRMDRDHDPSLGVVLAITAPLYWFTANRPLSDMTGLAATLAVQVLILRADTTRDIAIASCCAAFAVGFRTQVAVLTVPLLIATGFGLRGSGSAGRLTTHESRLTALFAYVGGAVCWLAPLIVLSGGPRAYWHALFDQGAEDLSGIRMLWTTPTVRELVDALYYAFVAPWATWPLATVVLLLAAVGVTALWRRHARALTLVGVAFGPYLLFDILFQETFTSRYALPLVVPIAFLAAAGARAIPAHAGTAIAIGAAMFSAHVGGTSLAAYARQPAPAFRLMADMANASAEHPVVGMDRREAFDLRKPMLMTDAASSFSQTLPSPPQHEWLAAVNYWTGGGRGPVWFLADPKRTDIDLIQHGEPTRYRWNLPYPVLIDGVRPNEIDWHRLRPEWFVGPGWALTPEAAGTSHADRAGPPFTSLDGHLWRVVDASPAFVMIGGRNLGSTTTEVIARLDDDWTDEFAAAPGPFLRMVSLPQPAASGYGALSIRVDPPQDVAIEQFDYSTSRSLLGFGSGWHEAELNPDTGVRWRWLSGRGRLSIASRGGQPIVLHLEGESPRKYFSRPSTIRINTGSRELARRSVDADFSIDVPLPANADSVTIDTDQTYVPAERSRRTLDRRQLGLRIFRCELRPASSPDK
ncbi:MAG TPA: hypothetical protein VFA59_25935 [Vicinamibacterales bacterium]|nr:hypothetical protein [Vicinamibacterales bacterium]